MRARTALGTLLAVAILAIAAGAPPAPAAERCPKGFTCSDLPVPLDRANPGSGTLDLRIARHRASAGPGKPLLMSLGGGPGQAALPFAADDAAALRPFWRRYQIVLFDQRGSGASGAIDCPALQRLGEFPSADAARRATAACGAALGGRAGDYSTAATVEDIEAIRQSVGADKVALIGVSYGTHVIQRYLLAHPEHVDRVVLDSAVEPGGVDVFQRDSFAAVPRVLKALRPGAPAATAKLVGRLAQGSMTGTAYGADGRPHPLTLRNAGELFNLLVAGDSSELLRTQFPAAVAAANAGDRLPLMRLLAIARADDLPVPRELSAGLYAATICTDLRLPWAPDSPADTRGPLFDAAAAALDPGPLAPFDDAAARDASPAGPCTAWPPTSTRPDQVPDAYPAVPALILAGLADIRTPLESAQRVARLIPGARLVTARGTGHDVLHSARPGCPGRALRVFLRGGTPSATCRRAGGLDAATPDFPLRLAQLGPIGGRGRAGRVLHAALRTVQDAEQRMLLPRPSPKRAGGLRGGTATATVRPGLLRLKLDRYVFLPGLKVTGAIATRNHVAGLVRLTGIARGTVSFGRNDVTARINGRRLVVRGR